MAVLCIGSDEQLQQQRKLILARVGYEVLTCPDLASAAESHAGDNIECVVIDWRRSSSAPRTAGEVRRIFPGVAVVLLGERGLPEEVLLSADVRIHPLDGPEALIAAVDTVVSARFPILGCPTGRHAQMLEPYAVFADSQGHWTWVNAGICRLLGYTREELMLISPRDVTSPELKRSPEKMWEEFAAAGEQKGRYMLRAKDGRDIVIQYTAEVLPDGCCVAVWTPESFRRNQQAKEKVIADRRGTPTAEGSSAALWAGE